MVQAQEWLDKNYPKNGKRVRETENELWNNKGKTRSEITKLDISYQNLEGELDLSDFVNLEILYCWVNKLTNLSIKNCNNLKGIRCPGNKLTNLNALLDNCNPEKLERLFVGVNNFSSDLTPFSRLVNLKELRITNNPFFGSLQPLQNCTKLEVLYISDTDIDSGLEYLPDSIEYFSCSRLGSKSKTIELELRKFGKPKKVEWGENFAPLLKLWQQAHRKKIAVQEFNSDQQLLLELEQLGISPKELNLPELLTDSTMFQQLDQAEQRLTAKLTNQSSKEIARLEQQVNSLRITAPILDWTNIHSDFTTQIVQNWQEKNFAYEEVREWINTGFQPSDYLLATYLRDELNLTAETALNLCDRTTLELKYQTYLTQSEFQSQIQTPFR